MDEKRDYYLTLELQPGASPAEIKAAYRRLAKLYHPDHDQSLDAEVKYRDIRVAYETLRDLYLVGGASAESVTSPDYSEQATWTSADWTTEYDVSNKRIPLEWKRLHSIFINSLKEMSIGVFFRGIVVLACAFISCDVLHDPMQSSGKLAALFYITSWILFVFFRYYFSPSEWSFFTRIATAILYGATLIILIACFYTIPWNSLIEAGILAAVSVWFLLVHLDELAYL
ncbi:MAG: DnaJ domain-containing protein [Synergistaceae bacterium]|nr:DnaJ domain-containing protein [Synergistaceae bacterium]